MFRDASLKTRLLFFGILLSMVPLLIAIGSTVVIKDKILLLFGQELDAAADADLEHIVQGVNAMCRAQQDVIQESVNHALNMAREILTQAGGAALSDEIVKWEVINQYSKDRQAVQLSKFMVGGQWIGQIKSMTQPTLIVDKVQNIAGATCTLFQRINPDGDMLRVATNVITLDGQRAIGTFIPQQNPDGSPNPVVAHVLRGETFRGRAYVVNRWYITAYEPIYDGAQKVIGMLYVGIPQERVDSLRQAIMSIAVGKTGYVWVLDHHGNYVISLDGKRDGENILNMKDNQGRFPIQDIIQKANALQPGNTGEHVYAWKNTGESAARNKIAKFVYFKDWDWIIGAGAYVDEFNDAKEKVEILTRKSVGIFILIVVLTMAITIGVWLIVAKGIVQPIIRSVGFAKAMAAGDFTHKLDSLKNHKIGLENRDEISQLYGACSHLSVSLGTIIREVKSGVAELNTALEGLENVSNQVDHGAASTSDRSRRVAVATKEMSANMQSVAAATEQAAGNINIVAGATEEMSTTIQEIAQNTEKARSVAAEAVQQSQEASQQVDQLGSAANQINRVTDVITEISEQTNLLALNATIEAARAGEAGKGFAVVANEIKELARQTAAATLEIKSNIGGIQRSTGDAVGKMKTISGVINGIHEIVSVIASSVGEQAATTQDIALNISQATQGIQDVNCNIAQSSTGTREIAKEVSEVSQAANEMANSGSQLNLSTKDLRQLSVRLEKTIAQFQISD